MSKMGLKKCKCGSGRMWKECCGRPIVPSSSQKPKSQKLQKMRMFPEQLNVNGSFEITESLTLDGVERILLSPSVCYLKDEIVQLEEVIKEIVRRYNAYKTIFQIHHQNKKTGDTEMVAQSGEIKSQKAMQVWQTDVAKRHPLPEGCQWFICNERDPRFVLACYEVEKC